MRDDRRPPTLSDKVEEQESKLNEDASLARAVIFLIRLLHRRRFFCPLGEKFKNSSTNNICLPVAPNTCDGAAINRREALDRWRGSKCYASDNMA